MPAKKRRSPRLRSRRYGPRAAKKIGRVMREYKRGTLKTARGRRRVQNRKQAIAIGISEARRAGAKVPPRKRSRRARKRRK